MDLRSIFTLGFHKVGMLISKLTDISSFDMHAFSPHVGQGCIISIAMSLFLQHLDKSSINMGTSFF